MTEKKIPDEADQIPPIIKSIEVNADPRAAFRAFVDNMHEWWPLDTHSLSAAKQHIPASWCGFDPRVGGAVYERLPNGDEIVWGRIRVYEPGVLIAFTWQLERPDWKAGEVEVSFRKTGEGRTLVRLIHSGWEKLGEEAQSTRNNYENGWENIFVTRFASFVGDRFDEAQ